MNKTASGRIIRGVGGFYYVHLSEGTIYECRAKGIFRNKMIKPLVGDLVRIDILDEGEKKGNLIEIYPRKSELFRPASANVDQAVVLFAARNPDPNYILLDKFLITMNTMNLPVILCFNKTDLVSEEEIERLRSIYQNAAELYFISVDQKKGLDVLKEKLKGHTTVLAGPSGAGKSSFLNYFCTENAMQTGTVSEKIGRGRHTTRHAQLFYVDFSDETESTDRKEELTYLMDTPGFSSMMLKDISYKELRFYYPEFDAYEGTCRFQGCVHVSEPDCSVKSAVKQKMIAKERYDSYCYLYEELKQKKTY